MEWIKILKCPISGDRLGAASPAVLYEIDQLRLNGNLMHINGTIATEIVTQALISSNGLYTYPIINGIVLLLKELSLITDRKNIIIPEIDDDKSLVQNFYNEKGWVTNEEGNYEDAVIYEDLRDVSREYLEKCHNRVSRYLNTSGTYMLDAASGALQFPQYLQYSAGYNYRVCVDFSFRALTEARKKLGDKGLYILADITNLPFADNVMDGFISLNTIYHIPKEQQVTAVNELYRVLAPGGKGIMVYDWFKHSIWMNVCMLPFRAFVLIKNRTLSVFSKLLGTKAAEKRLYFYAHNQKFFRKNLPPYKLVVWRSLSVHFMRYYIHPWLHGEKILDWVYKYEEAHPETCGMKGEYPMLIFEK